MGSSSYAPIDLDALKIATNRVGVHVHVEEPIYNALIAELRASRRVVEAAASHRLCRLEGGNGEGWSLSEIESQMDAALAQLEGNRE